MTVASELSKIVHVTDGISVAFAVSFRFLHASHLMVIESRDGIETILTPEVQYSVTGANSQQGGTVVTAQALAAGAKLVIHRVVPLTQETHYPRNDPFPASAHEQVLDKLTMVDQQLAEGLSRAVKLPVSDPRTPEEFTAEFFQAVADALTAAAAASASAYAAASSEQAAQDAADQAQAVWNAIRDRFTVSTESPHGGQDGDIWFQVI